MHVTNKNLAGCSLRIRASVRLHLFGEAVTSDFLGRMKTAPRSLGAEFKTVLMVRRYTPKQFEKVPQIKCDLSPWSGAASRGTMRDFEIAHYGR